MGWRESFWLIFQRVAAARRGGNAIKICNAP
jgi:hypothetical protein